MNPRRTFLFVLAAYNEELALPDLLERIQQVMQAGQDRYRVVVVDDGSTDKTAEIAREWAARLPLSLISHPSNQGLGAALRTGLQEACKSEQAEALVVTMDADMTHDPAAAVSMAESVQVCDVVIASRYGLGGGEIGVSVPRRIFSRVLCGMMRTLFPLPGVHDYSSGFRLYRLDTVRMGFERWGDAFISEQGFTCMAEVLLKLRRQGARIGEMSFPLRYDRKQGASKLRVTHTIARYFFLMARELAKGRNRRAGSGAWDRTASASSAVSVKGSVTLEH